MPYGYLYSILLFCSCMISCSDDITTPVLDDDIMQGGTTTVIGDYITIFQQPAANLTPDEVTLHFASDAAFGDIFVTSPATNNYGLGPLFNQNSCESCHLGNGRSPFPTDPSQLKGLLLRISVPGENQYGGPLGVPGFGGQLQTKSVFGQPREADITWEEIKSIEQYVDGNAIELRRFHFQMINPYMSVPADLMISPRIAPPVIGLGLLEAIAEKDIRNLADPDDNNRDGISGKINYVWDFIHHRETIGRFGWKASQPSLMQQSAAAYHNDMGITSPIFSSESCEGQVQCDSLVDDPEIDMNTLTSAAFYPQSLAVPARRNAANEKVRNGKILFNAIGCASCHHPSYTTGTHPEFDFLSNQTIYPYTDLLLHDMGEGLADHRPDFKADGNEWRTPPLWGIGLTYTVGGHQNFLHDGRARNLEEAIMWHGGEGQASKETFRNLTKEEREDVIAFLESL